MQNGMITTQLTPHNRLYFVPTSKILIAPSKLGKTRRRLARRLVGCQVCRLGEGVASAHGSPRRLYKVEMNARTTGPLQD